MSELEELKKEMEETIKNDPEKAKLLEDWWKVRMMMIAVDAVRKGINYERKNVP